MNDRAKTNFLRPSVRLWGLLTAAGCMACLATVFGFLGRFCWFLDLFSHFRVQYLAGLACLGVLHFLGRRRWAAAALLTFALINLGAVLPQFFHERTPAPANPAPGRLCAMLLNVNTRRGDAARVRRVIEEAEPDILVLEEINTRWVADLAWLADAYPHSVVSPREDNFGIGLFSKLPITEKQIAHIGTAQVPSILATVATGRHSLRILATHPLPPAGREYSRLRNEQLERLPEYVSASRPLIVVGDLNATPWNHHFRRLLRRTGLCDSSRGWGIQPTWPSDDPLLRIPLDHFLHSPDVFVVNRRVGPDVRSDHYPLIVDFTIGTQ